jgi:3-phenylpropionate/cinnamic acid dioxygenase small subunit
MGDARPRIRWRLSGEPRLSRRALLEAVLAGGSASLAVGATPHASAAQLPERRMEWTISEISDRLQIEDLMVRYCYAIDDRDWEAYRSLFTSDAVIDDTVTGGIRSGAEEHVAYLQRALSKVEISQHAISTVLIRLNGNEATARSHCSCPMVVKTDDNPRHVFFQGLWYRDKLRKGEDGWRFSERLEEGYWTRNLPADFKF